VMEIKWGLIPDMSGTQSLRRWCARRRQGSHLHRSGGLRDGGPPCLGLVTRVAEVPRAAARSPLRTAIAERKRPTRSVPARQLPRSIRAAERGRGAQASREAHAGQPDRLGELSSEAVASQQCRGCRPSFRDPV
jgi:hypothetical protein